MSTQGDLLGAADARELVPGDPGRLNDVATLLQAYSSDLATAAQALTTLSTSTWTGVAADQFRATFAPQPGRWRTAADAFAQASRATSAYATSLLLAQDDAADALVRFRRGAEGLPVAMLVGPRSEAALAGITHDPGVHDRLLAVIALDEARERVRTAGVAAHNAIRSATADAPENAAWWQSAAAVLGAMAWTGAKATWNNVLVPAINGVASFGAAMTSNPVGSMYLGAGVLMVIGGAALDVGGAAVCVTGVGCAATPAAEAAGTGLIVSGVGVAAGGAASVAGTAAANPITVVERTGKKGAGDATSGQPPPPRKFNIDRSQSPVWNATQPFRGKTRTNALSGSSKRYYEWDNTHNDIEAYDKNGKHLGTLDPMTGVKIKPAQPGRDIDV